MITVKNLTKTFGDLTAVDDVSFEVRPGEVFAFLGPNGAGKSTTIKMLTTLLPPTRGEILLNGFDVLAEPDQVRRSIGLVFQDPTLDLELTAHENMVLHAVLYHVPKAGREEKIRHMLEFVELWERKHDLVKTFSGGMKRRLEIARGLLHHPAVLFLDEPTLGLDPQTRNHMWRYLEKLVSDRGMTVFFTTHYMEEAEKIAQRLAVIDHGKIVASGTAAELKERTGTKTLEEAFLAFTGHEMREEGSPAMDERRALARAWTSRR